MPRQTFFRLFPRPFPRAKPPKTTRGWSKWSVTRIGRAKTFYNYYKNNFADKRVALVYDSNNREIVEIAAAIQGEFRKEGDADKLRAFSFETYNQNYGRLADAIFKNNIDLAYILGKSRSIAKLSKELKSEKKGLCNFYQQISGSGRFQQNYGRFGRRFVFHRTAVAER